MNERKGFSRLSDLTSVVELPSEMHTCHTPIQNREAPETNCERASRTLPGEGDSSPTREPARSVTEKYFFGIIKLLRAIPWQVYIACCVFGFFYFQNETETKTINIFQSEISNYLIKNNSSNIVPLLTPGILPVELGTKTVDKMLFNIKEDYRPKSTKDVSYVVGYKCSDTAVGSYSDGSSGFQKSCDIYVIDVRSHTWSYVGKFNGSEPPKSKKGSGSRTGSHPAQDYLRRIGIM